MRGTTLRLALTLAATLASVSPAMTAEQEIATYVGEGSGASRPFTATGSWEAQFSGKAAFMLMSSGGKLVGVMGGNANGAPGSYYSPTAGTYYLDVSAVGAWRIRIVAISR